MGNEFDEFNDVLGRFGRSNEDGAPKRIAEAAKQLSGRLNGLLTATVDGSDAGGYVSATVTLRGRIESVYISPEAIRDLRGQALDQACVDAITAAKRAGTAALTEQLEGLTGQRLDIDRTA